MWCGGGCVCMWCIVVWLWMCMWCGMGLLEMCLLAMWCGVVWCGGGSVAHVGKCGVDSSRRRKQTCQTNKRKCVRKKKVEYIAIAVPCQELRYNRTKLFTKVRHKG